MKKHLIRTKYSTFVNNAQVLYFYKTNIQDDQMRSSTFTFKSLGFKCTNNLKSVLNCAIL